MSDVSIWDLIQDYVDETGATEAAILRRAGLDKGLLSAWRRRGVPGLPDQGQLIALAKALKLDYEIVLNAVLHSSGYLPASLAEWEAQLNAAGLSQFPEGVRGPARDVIETQLRRTNGDRSEVIELLESMRAWDRRPPDPYAHEAVALYVLHMIERLPAEPIPFGVWSAELNHPEMTMRLAARGDEDTPPTNQSTKGG